MRVAFAFVAAMLAGSGPDAGSTAEIRRLAHAPDGGAVSGEGSMDPDEIRAVVRSHHSDLQRCLNQAHAGQRRIVGKSSIRWVIDQAGRVTSAELVTSTHGVPALDACLIERVREWRFPEPTGGGIAIVTYPFVFHDASSSDAGQPPGSREPIREIINVHNPELQRCYQRSLLLRPTLAGKCVVRFTIGSEGQVVEATMKESNLGAPEMDACILETVRKFAFPRAKRGGIAIVTYPFVFRHDGVDRSQVPDPGSGRTGSP